MSKYLITGSAGFIGFHVSKKLLDRGDIVIGVDNLNDYYDPKLKEDRLNILKKYEYFTFYKVDISDYDSLKEIFEKHKIDKVFNPAAQAGVRYSLENPFAYEKSNILGFLNILELCVKYEIKNLVYASSSSVYGNNKKIPFSENDNVDHPISLYAATKKSNELMAHVYHHLYGLKTTGLRYFTVYGPWGRPDMALFKFTKNIIERKPIDVYNYGKMKRDFTYIDDIVDGTISALDKDYDYEIFNLGNNKTVELNYFIEVIEKELNKKAIKNLMPIQPGDVPETFADIEKAKKMLRYDPKTKIEEGIKQFIKWYREYYDVQLE